MTRKLQGRDQLASRLARLRMPGTQPKLCPETDDFTLEIGFFGALVFLIRRSKQPCGARELSVADCSFCHQTIEFCQCNMTVKIFDVLSHDLLKLLEDLRAS